MSRISSNNTPVKSPLQNNEKKNNLGLALIKHESTLKVIDEIKIGESSPDKVHKKIKFLKNKDVVVKNNEQFGFEEAQE